MSGEGEKSWKLRAKHAEAEIIRCREIAERDGKDYSALHKKNVELRGALQEALISHANLYKSVFGEDADPEHDIVRLHMKKALTS